MNNPHKYQEELEVPLVRLTLNHRHRINLSSGREVLKSHQEEVQVLWSNGKRSLQDCSQGYSIKLPKNSAKRIFQANTDSTMRNYPFSKTSW